jgi:hypothetical protein
MFIYNFHSGRVSTECMLTKQPPLIGDKVVFFAKDLVFLYCIVYKI